MDHLNEYHLDPTDPDSTPAILLEQLAYVDTFMPEMDDPTQLDERLTAELSAFADESFIFPDEEKPKHDDNNTFPPMNMSFDHVNYAMPPPQQLGTVPLPQATPLHHNRFGSERTPSQYTQQFPQPGAVPQQVQRVVSTDVNGAAAVTRAIQQVQPSQEQSTMTHLSTNELLLMVPKVRVPAGAQRSLRSVGYSQQQIDSIAAIVAHNRTRPSESRESFTPATPREPSVQAPADALLMLNSAFVTAQHEPHSSDSEVESDKKRRNTVASAKFRVKKKIKEKELEETVRELNELAVQLQNRINTLEMENRLLKNLVIEKGEQRTSEELEELKKRAIREFGRKEDKKDYEVHESRF